MCDRGRDWIGGQWNGVERKGLFFKEEDRNVTEWKGQDWMGEDRIGKVYFLKE